MLVPLLLIGALSSGGSEDGPPPEPEPEGPAGNLIRGTEAGDLRDGTDGNDLMLGGPGSDDLAGFDGDDFLLGEGGNDTLYGNGGSDLVVGGRGDDLLFGGNGNDALVGGAGDDEVYGGAGNDDLYGMTGRDSLYGGSGNDLIVGVDPREGVAVAEVLEPLLDVLPASLANRLGTELATRFEPRIMKDLFSADLAEGDGDLLSGGAGDDLILFDPGDQVFGGDGTDGFALIYPGGSTPAVIEDYAIGERIALVVSGPATGTVSVAQSGSDAMVLIDGQDVLLLRGVLATSVALSDIVLTGTGT